MNLVDVNTVEDLMGTRDKRTLSVQFLSFSGNVLPNNKLAPHWDDSSLCEILDPQLEQIYKRHAAWP